MDGSCLRWCRCFTTEKLFLLNGEGLLPRVPLAKPDGTLGLPFGALPAPRAKPREPHPTPHAFFAFGSNAPNPLAGDGVILGIGKAIKELHRLFGSHRGIGVLRPAFHPPLRFG